MYTRRKERARELRKIGFSIGAISHTVAASKGSVSRWCHDIVLSAQQRKLLTDYQQKASIAALRRAAKQKHKERVFNARKTHRDGIIKVGDLSARDFFIAGLALYWGEGSKKGPGEVEFTNSEPASIIFMVSWFRKIYNIPLKDFVLRVTINAAHKQRNRDVLAFWSHLTHIPLTQFTETSFVKTKQKRFYKNFSSHFGTLRIKARRSTELRRQILGSLEALGRKTPRR